ncbi:hypothetical protein AB9G26_03345 [Francisella philomiragia]|uniref:hypothetical protein n=1 Tax=Francisella philomiragia TaxID=28110 RepID=UPI003518E5A6
MMIKTKENGISLVEVLVTVTIMITVSYLIVQSFYQMRKDYYNLIDNFKSYEKIVESKIIFQNLIENSYISGNSSYSIMKKNNTNIGNIQNLNPFDFPLIYAQQEPLIDGGLFGTDYPSDVQNGTDVLVLQTIDSPQVLTSSITSGDTAISRPINSDTTDVADDVYLMITDDINKTLLRSSGTKTSSDNSIDLLNAIGQSYPSGSTLYTDYGLKVVYIRDTGETNDNSETNYELYESFYQTNNNGIGQTLLEGVSNMQISYNINGTWQRVASESQANNNYKRLWYRAIKGIKINYDLDGKPNETVISFNGIGGLN